MFSILFGRLFRGNVWEQHSQSPLLHQHALKSINGSLRALFESVKDVDAATGEHGEREKISE